MRGCNRNPYALPKLERIKRKLQKTTSIMNQLLTAINLSNKKITKTKMYTQFNKEKTKKENLEYVIKQIQTWNEILKEEEMNRKLERDNERGGWGMGGRRAGSTRHTVTILESPERELRYHTGPNPPDFSKSKSGY